jgi:predicted phosphodiesterase
MGQSDLKHRLIAELKEIASELGHSPTRDEYRKHTKIGEKAYRRLFGGFTPFLMAAGLKTYAEKTDKNAAFIAPIGSIQHDTAIKKPALGIKSKFLILGDTHFPWVNVGALEAVYQFIEANPDISHVIQVGDLYDMYSWAKFPRSHMLYTPKAEIELGRKMAEEMWSKIRAMLPKAALYQIMGNHDVRPLKKVMELAPEIEIFIEINRWYQFDSVHTVTDPREWLTIENYHFTHGHLSGLGSHAKRFTKNVICGHTHTGGVYYGQLESGKIIFELNAGYLGDPNSRPLSYTATKTVHWTVGFGVIDQWGPRFIPL